MISLLHFTISLYDSRFLNMISCAPVLETSGMIRFLIDTNLGNNFGD